MFQSTLDVFVNTPIPAWTNSMTTVFVMSVLFLMLLLSGLFYLAVRIITPKTIEFVVGTAILAAIVYVMYHTMKWLFIIALVIGTPATIMYLFRQYIRRLGRQDVIRWMSVVGAVMLRAGVAWLLWTTISQLEIDKATDIAVITILLLYIISALGYLVYLARNPVCDSIGWFFTRWKCLFGGIVLPVFILAVSAALRDNENEY